MTVMSVADRLCMTNSLLCDSILAGKTPVEGRVGWRTVHDINFEGAFLMDPDSTHNRVDLTV